MTEQIKEQLASHAEQLTDAELKSIIKLAIKEAVLEWIADQQQRVGRWTISGLAVLAIGGMIYLALLWLGFTRK